MTQMCITSSAADFDPIHTQRIILFIGDRFFGYGLPKTRPAGTGFVLGFGIEQGRATTHTTVDADIVAVPVFTGKSRLSAAFAANFILIRCQFFAPLIV
jgi:hypothetical protein